jgi:hypothetical protein
MKPQRILLLSKIYVWFSAISLLTLSMMAFVSPQAVMDLVQVKLSNNDAFSSIRGVYGGVGLTIFLWLLHTLKKDVQESLLFLSLFWGLYAVSRITTLMMEGPLGAFGKQWLGIETVFCAIAILLLFINKRLTVYQKL